MSIEGVVMGMIGRAQRLVAANPETFRPEFEQWLRDNQHIWWQFMQDADTVRAKGRKHYSARTIVEVLRHNSILRQTPLGEYKINDHIAPDLARLYMLYRPEALGFFELRGQRVPA